MQQAEQVREYVEQEDVTALIEVKIAPQHGVGYDRIARRIYQYDQVDSLYLMTGNFDLLVTMTAKSMKEAAAFVYETLATIEGVTATSTSFVMKKYKDHGHIFIENPSQEERIGFV